MSPVSRQIIALDILCQEMQEYHAVNVHHDDYGQSSSFLRLLEQLTNQMKSLAEHASEHTENGFIEQMRTSQTCQHIKSKQMLNVHCRLLEFVLAFYSADIKAKALLADDFGQLADKRLNLLQTRAIKARNQYKTVSQALGKTDYQAFIDHVGLPQQLWGWEELRID